MNSVRTSLQKNILLTIGIMVAMIIAFSVVIQAYQIITHNELTFIQIQGGILYIDLVNF